MSPAAAQIRPEDEIVVNGPPRTRDQLMNPGRGRQYPAANRKFGYSSIDDVARHNGWLLFLQLPSVVTDGTDPFSRRRQHPCWCASCVESRARYFNRWRQLFR